MALPWVHRKRSRGLRVERTVTDLSAPAAPRGPEPAQRLWHPVKYKPGEKKVSSFIEDVVNVVFA